MSRRVALVTGGTGTIGSEICRHLGRQGHRIAATCLPTDEEVAKARTWETQMKADGIEAIAVACELSDFEATAAAVREVEQRLGPIDVLVNAAGITRDGTLRKMTPEQWSTVLRVNLDGVFNMCRQVVEPMCERGFGRIVNVASVNGQTGQFGQANYAASKAGIHGFTMSMAREVARKGVTVNSVSPGYCRTALVEAIPQAVRDEIVARIPVGRLGEPSEIARTVVFLTADDAGFITGANIPVNGGYFMDF
jgi:acetoacetyl-CoA reductase